MDEVDPTASDSDVDSDFVDERTAESAAAVCGEANKVSVFDIACS